jgi:TraG P-loop domain/Helicase HerA, central domain
MPDRPVPPARALMPDLTAARPTPPRLPRWGQGRPHTPSQQPGREGGVAPASLQVGPTWLRVGGDHVATLAVTGYPGEVGPGWLEPLLTWPGRLDVAVHVEPVPAVVAADRLRRQRARLESVQRWTQARGRLSDPGVDASAEAAADLAEQLARGQGHLFRVGIYLTVHAATPRRLQAAVAEVKALAASLLLDTQPATWRAVQGWTTTLPLGIDSLRLRRTLDTAALAAAFPFTSPDLPPPHPATSDPGAGGTRRAGVGGAAGSGFGGVVYGVNDASAGIVAWDRWSQDNQNAVILARSGAGKSFLAKLDVLRSLYTGVQVLVIDPEDEYTRLAAAVGGTVVRLGRPGVHLNPLDPPPPPPPPPDPAAPDSAGPGDPTDTASAGGVGERYGLNGRVLFASTVADLAVGGLSADEVPALDAAVLAAYHGAGINADPRTWARPAPLLADVVTHLRHDRGDPHAGGLAARLHRYTAGSAAGLFTGATTVRPEGHLVVFSLRDVPDELKPLATLLALDAIWRQVSDPSRRRRRMVVIDEAWQLMRQPVAAGYLYAMAKAARKHWAGLTVITQDAADLLGTDLGQAVVANAATQLLLRQAPQALDPVTEAFGLSEGERAYLATAPQGHALLLAGGTHRVAFHAVASPTEAVLASTSPADLTDGGGDPAGPSGAAGVAAGRRHPHILEDE